MALVTEEQAKQTLCFQAATFAASQQLVEGAGPFCVGSACMAWRWGPSVWIDEVGGKWHGDHPPPVAAVKLEHGYCGRAGRPE